MPRKGYRSLTLPEADYLKLEELARLYGTTVPRYLGILISEPESLTNPPSFGETFVPSKVSSNPDGPANQSFLAAFDSPDEKRLTKKLLRPADLTGCTVHLDRFLKFCEVDLRLERATALNHRRHIERILEECGPSPTTDAIRQFLAGLKADSTRNNYIKSLRVFYRDFLGDPSPVASFRLKSSEANPPRMPSKQELRRFYGALGTLQEKALFLLYATTGRRRKEILYLLPEDVIWESRCLMPNRNSSTKHTWFSFFNSEAEAALREYLELEFPVSRKRRPKYLFSVRSAIKDYIFTGAQEKTGLEISPRVLRFWFANEMGRLGVAERYINALQGRVPRSVLARHYTDYSMENLKQVYDRAGLKVLPIP